MGMVHHRHGCLSLREHYQGGPAVPRAATHRNRFYSQTTKRPPSAPAMLKSAKRTSALCAGQESKTQNGRARRFLACLFLDSNYGPQVGKLSRIDGYVLFDREIVIKVRLLSENSCYRRP